MLTTVNLQPKVTHSVVCVYTMPNPPATLLRRAKRYNSVPLYAINVIKTTRLYPSYYPITPNYAGKTITTYSYGITCKQTMLPLGSTHTTFGFNGWFTTARAALRMALVYLYLPNHAKALPKLCVGNLIMPTL